MIIPKDKSLPPSNLQEAKFETDYNRYSFVHSLSPKQNPPVRAAEHFHECRNDDDANERSVDDYGAEQADAKSFGDLDVRENEGTNNDDQD